VSIPDLFVGGVATVLGVIVLVGAIGNYSWWFALRKARWLDTRLGRQASRVLFSLMGIMLILLGLAIAGGFAPNASS
tara:strand:- start:186 stop:416 length:231 start_codon:yes stop_codon:yes gene_type:complete